MTRAFRVMVQELSASKPRWHGDSAAMDTWPSPVGLFAFCSALAKDGSVLASPKLSQKREELCPL